MPRSKPNTGVIRYAYNGGWNHSWTKEQVRILKDMKTAGAGVAEITDRVFEAEGGVYIIFRPLAKGRGNNV